MTATQPWLLNPDPDWPGTLPRPDGDGWIWCTNAPDKLRRFGNPCDVEIVAGANEAVFHEAFREHHVHYGTHRIMYETAIGGYVNGFGHMSVRGIGIRGGAWVRRSTPEWAKTGEPEEPDL